jgi:transcriptional regulator with PAS, ATPase and Fis domain
VSSGPDGVTHTLPANSLVVRAVTVHVTRGPDAGRVLRIEGPSFVVGTGELANLRLTDAGVSREHLRLQPTANGVRIRDGGSKNGTFMGAMRVYDLAVATDVALVLGSTTLGIAIAADAIELPMSSAGSFGEAIGTSTSMRHLFATLERAAATELTVLLEGESGVGKDLLARAIHAASPRRAGPLVVADCGAIAENLIESELFGHERGAFTGADRARKGLFEEANGGTLFLDEVGELPLDLQPKLLRALEQREVRPVGGRAAQPIDVRVVAATNKNLAEAVVTGGFRSDLFYRLAVVRATVPPLRERPEDVLPIARVILRKLKADPEVDLPEDFAARLVAYAWPGNVRELRNTIERHAALGASMETLFEQAGAPSPGGPAELERPYYEARQKVVDHFDERYVKHLLERANGNITRAAEIGEIARPSLYRLLDRLNLNPKR